MSKQIVTIPLVNISRLQIYINKSVKTLAQIKQETGADYILNGGLYEGTKAVCHLKADGYVYASDQYTYWGYAWDNGSDISMQVIPKSTSKNYISCVELIRDKKPNPKPIYNKDVGGARGRTAMGIKNNNLCLYVTGDGTSDAKNPESLRDELMNLGWESAMMLDGGGSSQCDFNGQKITSSRKVHNLILVYLKKDGGVPVTNKKYTVCLDPGHHGKSGNASPDKTYYEYKFTWDISQRIKKLLEYNGVNVVLTKDSQDANKSLTDRAGVSNTAKADLFISPHTNAVGSGWSNARGLEVYTSYANDKAGRNIAANKMIARFKEAGIVLRQPTLRHNNTFTVLVKTNAPAVLIEYGFHTNKEDVALLLSDAYKDKLAEATVKGICDYFGVPYKAPQSPTTPVTPPSNTVGSEASKWASEAWQKAVSKGIMDGTNPQGNVTREMLAVVLSNLGLL